MTSKTASVPELIAEAKAGRPFILTDDESRENEGDVVIPACFATPEIVNFMITHARGIVCLALEKADTDRLGLRPMTEKNESAHQTAFTDSIEAREGVTTGVSAYDRARTISVAIDPKSGPHDIVIPGHMYPLIARAGGVFERQGHTEGAVDLMKLAGLPSSAAVICEVVAEDGHMARLPDLLPFAAKHGLKIGTIAAVLDYRKAVSESVSAEAFDEDIGAKNATKRRR
jgi:3,4-dihydroxy 2-butanone 4-phosphate synthase/GTP cyclohydrolase II